jgi:hypothetical protein
MIKIAVYGDSRWAIGRIYFNVIKYLSHLYEFKRFNWDNEADRKEFYSTWEDYDIILTTSTMSSPKRFDALKIFNKEKANLYYSKLICVVWAEPNLNNYFIEDICYHSDILWAAPTNRIIQKLYDTFSINAEYVIGGVNPKEFPPTRTISQIKSICINGASNKSKGWDEIKRPQMLVYIANKANINHKFIHGLHLEQSHKMYSDIDMYVCTSTSEAGPYGIAECAFCKIPVISTPVGYAELSNCMRTFNTVEEAVKIINELNSSPAKLKKYIDDVHKEFVMKLNWEYVSTVYWIPLIEKRIALNKN